MDTKIVVTLREAGVPVGAIKLLGIFQYQGAFRMKVGPSSESGYVPCICFSNTDGVEHTISYMYTEALVEPVEATITIGSVQESRSDPPPICLAEMASTIRAHTGSDLKSAVTAAKALRERLPVRALA